MKIRWLAIAAVLLAGATVEAQDAKRLYTNPSVPPREALERLNLKLAWRTYVPMDGRRDGILSVQMADQLLLVQTRSGQVLALDAETGQTRWRARVGNPYRGAPHLAVNLRSVFVISELMLYSIDLATGDLQWEFEMREGAAAAPVADDDQVFLTLGDGKVYAYELPRPSLLVKARNGRNKKPETPAEPSPSSGPRTPSNYNLNGMPASIGPYSTNYGIGTTSSIGPLSSAREATRGLATGLQPRLDFEYLSDLRLELAPLQTEDTILYATPKGVLMAMPKGLQPVERYRRELSDGRITVQPGQHGDEAYVATDDAYLYAIRISTGNMRWRIPTGTALLRKPVVTDDDVFVAPDRGGLYRLDRAAGEAKWHNRTAYRFLAGNRKFVYATDASGRLLLLDRARGTLLSVYDARAFVVPIPNEVTDRLYLATNDGLLLCLHDREYTTPLRIKKEEVKASVPRGRPDDQPRDKGDKPKGEGEGKDKPKDKGDEMEKKG